MKKTINKNNWSGEEITYDKRKRTVKVHDTVLLLQVKKTKDGEEHGKVLLKDWCGKGQHHQLCSVYKYKDEWYASEMGVEREGKELDEVAVEMYCNLV